jgi:hypothetical protein
MLAPNVALTWRQNLHACYCLNTPPPTHSSW